MHNDGVGLGLTISKLIIERSGGSIRAESDGEGQGTLFIFSMKMNEVSNGESVENGGSAGQLLGIEKNFRFNT